MKLSGTVGAALSGIVIALLGILAPPATADPTGPDLHVPAAQLDASLSCTPNLAHAARNPVLLIPGTSADPNSSYGWNYMKAFAASGVPYCGVTLPNSNNLDIQTDAEYIVHAIRAMHSQSGRKVDLVGWSQGGGPEPRWALKYWPDARNDVQAFVALDPANRGSEIVNHLGCGVVQLFCAPAVWQMMPQSKFMTALNSGPMTFPGITYTVIYSTLSNLIQPNMNGEMGKLPPGPNVGNIALQGVCGTFGTNFDHVGVVASAVTYNLVTQAIDHPDRPAAVTPATTAACGAGTMPSADMGAYLGAAGSMYMDGFTKFLPRDAVNAEPPLRCYATLDKRNCVA
ncbi:MAG: hypothetical protein J2P18_06595 [Nocardia sp.]|nr:hypothetical protein [Nocardia sp.]